MQNQKNNFLTYLPSIVGYNGNAYFQSTDNKMWGSDGTENGTYFLKNVNPQFFDNIAFFTNSMNTVLNNTLYFAGNDGTSGMELWKTDGTPGGTVLVKGIFQGSGSSITGNPTGYFTNVNDVFYFLANDNIHGLELWKSDGTELGTVMVKDITVGSGSSRITCLTKVGDKLAFLVYDYSKSKQILWQSDGTEAGTHPVNDANLENVIIYDDLGGFKGNPLVGLNNRLYFTGYTPQYGFELWTGTLDASLPPYPSQLLRQTYKNRCSA